MEVVPILLSVLSGIVVLYILYVLVMYIFFNEFVALTSLEQASNNTVVVSKNKLANGSNTGNYTYSIWVYVQDWNYGFNQEKPILCRKKADSNENALKIYMGATANNIIVETLCYGDNNSTAKCEVDNFPLQTWVNLTVSQYGRTCDVYIDGKLVRTCVLPGTAVAGGGDITITEGVGFHGYTCKLRYFDNASNPQQAYNIYRDGPCSLGVGGGYRLVLQVMRGEESKYKLVI
tara:strand:- start:9091 stop:9789 length:699 start_codon:yes stop_codon:yes gene_type:complete